MRTMTRTRILMAMVAFLAVAWLASALRAAAPPGHFVVNGMIVTDSVTGLVWQKQEDGTPRNYTAGNTYRSTNAPGLPGAGWRLPTLKELTLLFDPSLSTPQLWDPAFGGAGGNYFTSDSRPPNCGGGYCQLVLNFDTGVVGSIQATDVNSLHHARCVR